MTIDQSVVDAVVDAVKQSRKYRDTSEETIRPPALASACSARRRVTQA